MLAPNNETPISNRRLVIVSQNTSVCEQSPQKKTTEVTCSDSESRKILKVKYNSEKLKKRRNSSKVHSLIPEIQSQ